MTNLIIGLILFLGMHSISIVAEPLRDRLAAKSKLGWKALYALISLVGILLIVKGYSQVRLSPTLIYESPFWLRHFSALLMLPVFILFLAPYFPGIISHFTKNPQLFSVILWALSHLLVNGHLADILLFGAFFVWAVADLMSMKHRVPRPLPRFKESAANDVIIVIVGLGLYALFAVYLHGAVIGMPLYK